MYKLLVVPKAIGRYSFAFPLKNINQLWTINFISLCVSLLITITKVYQKHLQGKPA